MRGDHHPNCRRLETKANRGMCPYCRIAELEVPLPAEVARRQKLWDRLIVAQEALDKADAELAEVRKLVWAAIQTWGDVAATGKGLHDHSETMAALVAAVTEESNQEAK